VKRHRNILHRRAGVTLIDMVVVLSILAVLGAVALPTYSLSLTRYRVAAAANRIAADLSLAQTVARTTSAGQTVTFTLASNSYQFSNYAGPLGGTAQANYTVSLATDPYQASFSAVNFNSTTALTYDRFGQPSSGGTIVVQVGTAQKTITVDANTGKVAVQ
jgi:Tfp pilus assembly protein FimT